MKLVRKGHGHAHRGVIGVESAIVMIAFVIVAVALVFVVLNMGFATTQKAKTTTISALSEASSSLEVAGKVIGIACTDSNGGCAATPYLNATSYPLKIASGGDSVDLDPARTQVKYLSNSVEYDDIYTGPVTSQNSINVTQAWEWAGIQVCNTSCQPNPVNETATYDDGTQAIIYWTVGANNAILDQGEHAVVSISYDRASPDDRPTALDKIRAEILLPTGAPLTIERDVPNITNTVVDLG